MDTQTYNDWKQSRYGRVIQQAEEAKSTHYERQRELTLKHFQRHPECLNEIIQVDEQGIARRDKRRFILVGPRLKPNWYEHVGTWRAFDDTPLRIVERDAVRSIDRAVRRLQRLKVVI